jgi:hypothetical protein
MAALSNMPAMFWTGGQPEVVAAVDRGEDAAVGMTKLFR